MMIRLDALLVERGLAESRAKARAAIEAGGVTVDGHVVDQASRKFEADALLSVVQAHRFVGRGALKLDHALSHWSISIEGKIVVDVGASTGGFTEVCLERGAARVFAVDVGRGQMHPRLSGDDRVVNLEGIDARELTVEQLDILPSLIVCDASFISLTKILPSVVDLVEAGSDLVALIKPQFEAEGPKTIGKKGVVKDPEAHRMATDKVSTWLQLMGWTVHEIIDSPITGSDGNVEFLIWATKA